MPNSDSKWAQHMDKIAYAVAACAGIVVLALPFLLGGQVNDVALDDAVTALNEKVATFREEIRTARSVPESLRGVLEAQWAPGPASTIDPTWVTERAPALLRQVKAKMGVEPKHLPGKVTEISCQRDAKKKHVYLLVKGLMNGLNENVVITKVVLSRKEGDGDWAAVEGFDAKGDFEFSDYQVSPGKTYSYKFASYAQRDPAAPKQVLKLKDASRVVQSENVLGPTEPVPYDISLTISQIPRLRSQADTPKFLGTFAYYDYVKGTPVRAKGTMAREFREGQRVGSKGRYEFLQVDDVSQTVTVKDHAKRGAAARHVFKSKTARKPRPIDCWASALTAQEPAKEGEGTEAGAAKTPGAKAAEKPPAKKTTAGGSSAKTTKKPPPPKKTSGSKSTRRGFLK